jgi:hypothetical protein
LNAFERGGEGRRRRIDGKVRPVDVAKLVRIRIDVDEFRLRIRNVQQRIALARHFAEPPADQQDEIGRLSRARRASD